jgi:hypothetical protein
MDEIEDREREKSLLPFLSPLTPLLRIIPSLLLHKSAPIAREIRPPIRVTVHAAAVRRVPRLARYLLLAAGARSAHAPAITNTDLVWFRCAGTTCGRRVRPAEGLGGLLLLGLRHVVHLLSQITFANGLELSGKENETGDFLT